MHKKTEVICGESELKPNFEEIGNNPNFVFENDPNFETSNGTNRLPGVLINGLETIERVRNGQKWKRTWAY